MKNKLQEALNDEQWKAHKLGDIYNVIHANGKKDNGWKISYYPLFGTWDNITDKEGKVLQERWIEFEEPRALVEKKIGLGTDFREMPLRYLVKNIERTEQAPQD